VNEILFKFVYIRHFYRMLSRRRKGYILYTERRNEKVSAWQNNSRLGNSVFGCWM